MKNNLYLFLIGAFLFVASGLFAQQNTPAPWCGTTEKSPWLTWYQAHRAEFVEQRDADTSWLYAPITIQIVGNDNGSGYFSLDKAIRVVCDMNDQYAPARIRWYLMPGDPVRYLNNTSWYIHDWDGGSDLINSNRLPNRLNAFVVADPAGNCGYSWQDAIVLGKSCSQQGNSTWAHEAGHHLSLPHPFFGWENTTWNYGTPAPEQINNRQVEKTDTSNCYDAGDGFCDTRPDYLNYRWPCNGDGISLQEQIDPNGVPFHSDGTLIMGYSYDNCANRFSPEQIEAMRMNLHTQHQSYLQISQPLTGVDDNAQVQLISPIDSQQVNYQQIELSWNPIPDATIYHVEISILSSFGPIVFSRTVYNQTSVVVDKNMPVNYLMYWRVRAYNEFDVCNPNDNMQVGVFKSLNLTATNELERTLSVNISPNPVISGQELSLNIASADQSKAVLTITDAAGRVCRTENIRIYPGDNQLPISTYELQAGMYFVTLRNEKGSLTKPVAITE